MGNRPRLDSWKEIATYLGRDVRTVIRWEQNRGLPVYRVPGGKVSRVFAYPEELDAWLARGINGGDENGTIENGTGALDNPDAASRLARPIAAIGSVALLAALAVAGWTYAREPVPPARFAIEGRDLQAISASGDKLWTYRPPARDVASPVPQWSELDEGVVVTFETKQPASNQFGGELVRFANGGDARWSTSLDDRLRFRDGDYGPPWPAAHLTTYRAGRERRIAWTVHHFTWWPAILATFDSSGRRLSTFVNSGWIRAVTPTPDGRFLLMTGISNSRKAYFFAVLDPANPSGRSPEMDGSPYECTNCPDGAPIRYVVLPRTDISRAVPFPGEAPSVTTLEDGGALINSLESGGPNIATAIYELSSDLTIRSARFSSSFWEWHRQLELEGKLDHGVDACPERGGLDVETWTPAEGWQTARITAR